MPALHEPFLTEDRATLVTRKLTELRGDGEAPSYIGHLLHDVTVAVSFHPHYSDVRVQYGVGVSDRWLIGHVRTELTGEEFAGVLFGLLTGTPYSTFAQRLA